jgi:hypothetical protein
MLIFQLIANGLMLLTAVLFIVIPQFYYTVFFGRIIAGIASSLGYVVVWTLILCWLKFFQSFVIPSSFNTMEKSQLITNEDGLELPYIYSC